MRDGKKRKKANANLSRIRIGPEMELEDATWQSCEDTPRCLGFNWRYQEKARTYYGKEAPTARFYVVLKAVLISPSRKPVLARRSWSPCR